MTRRQSNNLWNGGIVAHPAPPQKNSECKNPLEISHLDFLGDQEGTLFIDYLLKGPTTNAEYYSSLLVQMDILTEKRRRKFTKFVLFLPDNAPSHRALATQQKLAYLGFQCLDCPPYSPDLAPSDYHLFPGVKKISWKIVIFRPTRWSLLLRRPGWTDKILNFLGGDLQKLEQRAKKCIELRGVRWMNPEFDRCSFFSFLVGLKTYQHPLIYSCGNKKLTLLIANGWGYSIVSAINSIAFITSTRFFQISTLKATVQWCL